MATNWKTPGTADVQAIIAQYVIAKTNESFGQDSQAKDQFNPGVTSRLSFLLETVVNEFRAAITSGAKVALSLTAGTVPPDVLRHVLNLTAWQLVTSTPELAAVIITQNGKAQSPLGKLADDAIKQIERCRKGDPMTAPSDPDPATKPYGAQWGSGFPQYDLQSEVTTSVITDNEFTGDPTTDPTGNIVP